MSGDVIVVGAGLSGLVCALELERSGRTVMVVDAADRIGGKVLTAPLGGHHVDYGAHWVGGDQTAVLGLAREFGVATAPEPQRRRGAAEVFSYAGRVGTYHGQIPPIPMRDLLAVGVGIARMEVSSRRIHRGPLPLVDGWSPLDDEMSDQLTRRFFSHGRSRDVLTFFFRLVFGADPDQVPARAALEYLRAAGSLRAVSEVRDGAQERYFVDGAGALVDAVAQRLSTQPVLNCAVRAVREGASGVEVVTSEGTVDASAAVLAVPLPCAADMDLALPPLVAARVRDTRMGEYAKTFLVYDRPWWRSAGLTGTALDTDGPIQMVVDGNPGKDEPGILVAFSGGRAAADLFSREDRRDAVVDEVVRLFGSSARSPRIVDDITWSEQPWLGGAPTAIPARGGRLRPRDLRSGRIHWAGTDLAEKWPGYLDGAVRSGRRAAAEIVS